MARKQLKMMIIQMWHYKGGGGGGEPNITRLRPYYLCINGKFTSTHYFVINLLMAARGRIGCTTDGASAGGALLGGVLAGCALAGKELEGGALLGGVLAVFN